MNRRLSHTRQRITKRCVRYMSSISRATKKTASTANTRIEAQKPATPLDIPPWKATCNDVNRSLT